MCLHYRPETVHCSTKDAYNSKITIFTLLYFGFTYYPLLLLQGQCIVLYCTVLYWMGLHIIPCYCCKVSVLYCIVRKGLHTIPWLYCNIFRQGANFAMYTLQVHQNCLPGCFEVQESIIFYIFFFSSQTCSCSPVS